MYIHISPLLLLKILGGRRPQVMLYWPITALVFMMNLNGQGLKLHIPPLLKDKIGFNEDVIATRTITQYKIHVERAIC